MHFDPWKVPGVQTSSEPDNINEAKTGAGDKFQVVLDAGNVETFDTEISEKPSCGSKEGSLQLRDIKEKNVTAIKSGSKPLCVTSTLTSIEKKSQTQRGGSDSEKQHDDVGALTEVISPVNKSKLKEEDGEILLFITNNAVQDNNSERNSATDAAATGTGTVLCSGAKKALAGKVKEMTKESRSDNQFDAEDGINDTSSASLHYIGVDDEGEGEEESLRHRPIDEDVEGKEEEGTGGLEVGPSVDNNKYFKKAYSETGSSEGNSDSTRSIDQHVDAHKAAEPTSPTSRYGRLDTVSLLRDKGVVR